MHSPLGIVRPQALYAYIKQSTLACICVITYTHIPILYFVDNNISDSEYGMLATK